MEELSNEELEVIKQFKGAKNGGSSCFQVYDFGVRRPTSKEFWEELSKLGKLQVTNLYYAVDFQEEE